MSSFTTLIRLSRAVERPFCTRIDLLLMIRLRGVVSITMKTLANAADPKSLLAGQHMCTRRISRVIPVQEQSRKKDFERACMHDQLSCTREVAVSLTLIYEVHVVDDSRDATGIAGHEVDNLPDIRTRLGIPGIAPISIGVRMFALDGPGDILALESFVVDRSHELRTDPSGSTTTDP